MDQIEVRWLAVLAGCVAVALSGPDAAAQPAAAERATNVAGVTVSAAPPANFDALNATDAALAAYGFPPRPDATRNPDGYLHWARAVGSHAHRLVPQLQQTTIAHGPHIPAAARVDDRTSTSTNWSGFAADIGATTYSTSSFNTVTGSFIVPAVAARTCNGAWEYSSVWVGIDGYASSDVLQAGVEADAICSDAVSNDATSYYSAWYEWYPNNETRITNLTVAPGQSFSVHVWATSATAGHAYMLNVNTNQSVSISFSAPSGTSLLGESAEWIVESPTVGGTLATLPLYGLDYFSGASSSTGTRSVHKPGTSSSIAISLVRKGTTYSSSGLLGKAGILMTSH